MAVINSSKENFLDMPPLNETSLQEERKVTGRYLAVGIVIFLVVLGLYHAVTYGSTKMSALLGAALIMFLYLLWLLYASHRRKRLLKKTEKAFEEHVTEVMVSLNNLRAIADTPPHDNEAYVEENETIPLRESRRHTESERCEINNRDKEFERKAVLSRQYSIA